MQRNGTDSPTPGRRELAALAGNLFFLRGVSQINPCYTPFSIPLCKIQPVLILTDLHQAEFISLQRRTQERQSRTTWFATIRPPFERPIRARRPAGNHAQLRCHQRKHPPSIKWYPGIPFSPKLSQIAWHCMSHWCSSLVGIEQSQCRLPAISSRDGKTIWPLCFWRSFLPVTWYVLAKRSSMKIGYAGYGIVLHRFLGGSGFRSYDPQMAITEKSNPHCGSAKRYCAQQNMQPTAWQALTLSLVGSSLI